MFIVPVNHFAVKKFTVYCVATLLVSFIFLYNIFHNNFHGREIKVSAAKRTEKIYN